MTHEEFFSSDLKFVQARSKVTEPGDRDGSRGYAYITHGFGLGETIEDAIEEARLNSLDWEKNAARFCKAFGAEASEVEFVEIPLWEFLMSAHSNMLKTQQANERWRAKIAEWQAGDEPN